MTEVTAQAAPDPSLPDAVLGRRALERLDLLLLTVESLDMNGGEAMLWATRQLGFESIFPNRVSSGNVVATTHCGGRPVAVRSAQWKPKR